MSLRWTNGTVCERTPRQSRPVRNDIETMLALEAIRENTTYLHSLDDTMPFWLEPESLIAQQPTQLVASNRREESSKILAEREMMSQIGQNPFLGNHDNHYIRGLDMKAEATNFDKIAFQPAQLGSPSQ